MKEFNHVLKEELVPFSAFLIARMSMPQIKDVADFKSYLDNIGIDTEDMYGTVEVFKPTQFDYDQNKVDRIISSDMKNHKPIIVSQDYFVLDGHHRYYAALQSESPINILYVNLPINKLLKMAYEYPNV